jgi:hypothetical protein
MTSGFRRSARNFLKKHSLDDLGVDDDFVASLREKGLGRKVSL